MGEFQYNDYPGNNKLRILPSKPKTFRTFPWYGEKCSKCKKPAVIYKEGLETGSIGFFCRQCEKDMQNFIEGVDVYESKTS